MIIFQARSPFWTDPLVASPPPAHMAAGKFFIYSIDYNNQVWKSIR